MFYIFVDKNKVLCSYVKKIIFVYFSSEQFGTRFTLKKSSKIMVGLIFGIGYIFGEMRYEL